MKRTGWFFALLIWLSGIGASQQAPTATALAFRPGRPLSGWATWGEEISNCNGIRNGQVISTSPVLREESLTLRMQTHPGDWFGVVVRDKNGATLFSNAIYIER
jgi:hypothetical protein